MSLFRNLAWRAGLGVVALLFVACGSGNPDCKAACDRLSACGLKSSGFSCDPSCAPPQDRCAVCLNERACADIQAGKCQSECPNATFSK